MKSDTKKTFSEEGTMEINSRNGAPMAERGSSYPVTMAALAQQG